jgi:hypothetical protein
MSNLVILFIHFLATLARLLGPGGVRSIVAESLILKHQLLIVARSRQRSPNFLSKQKYRVLWLANCYFAHDSLGSPALLPFCDAPAGRSFHSSVPWPAARTWQRPFHTWGVTR